MGDLKVKTVLGRTDNGNATVDLYNSATFHFTQGAMGQYFGSAGLPDECRFQVDIRFFGSEGALFLDIERPRLELFRLDGTSKITDVGPQDWAYSLEGPIDTFMDLIRGRDVENRSPADLGARCVELAHGLVMSDAQGGATVDIGPHGEMAVVTGHA